MERSGPECIAIWFGVMFWCSEFDVRSLELCVSLFSQVLWELREWSGLQDVTLGHKHFLSVMWGKKLYVQHIAIEGLATAGGIQGTIADACVALLKWWGIRLVFKWVDDFIFFCSPSPTATTTRVLALNAPDIHFPYDITTILKFTAPLGIPWHPVTQKGQDFGNSFSYVGFFWNVGEVQVQCWRSRRWECKGKMTCWLYKTTVNYTTIGAQIGTLLRYSTAPMWQTKQFPTQRKRKWEHWLRSTLSPQPLGQEKMPGGCFSTWKTLTHYLRLSGWKTPSNCALNLPLQVPKQPCLTPHPLLNSYPVILVETVLGHPPKVLPHPLADNQPGHLHWCINILGNRACVGNWWAAWWLVPGWNTRGHDISWAEAVALELAMLWLAKTDQNDVCTINHSDNMGVIDTFNKGRLWNMHHNDCLQWISVILAVSNVSLVPCFIPSHLNKADPLSCGILGSREHWLEPSLILSPELSIYLVCSWCL